MLDWIMKLLGYERVENIKVPVQFKVPCVEKISLEKYQDMYKSYRRKNINRR